MHRCNIRRVHYTEMGEFPISVFNFFFFDDIMNIEFFYFILDKWINLGLYCTYKI